MAEKKCYTIRELQEMLGVSRQTLYVLLKKKYFHSVRIGGKYLVSKLGYSVYEFKRLVRAMPWISWMKGGLS